MKKTKAILPLMALILCLGAFLMPVTAYAQTPDTTPPTLTAVLDNGTLTATAKDDGSGVDSIYVGKHRFATLADGTAVLRFKDYAGTADKQVEVYATDVAGNRSVSVMVDNPYYAAPASPTPAPTPTPTPAPSATPTPAPSANPTPSPTEEPTPTPGTDLPEPQPPADGTTEEAIPDGGNAFTPDGGGTVQDNATDADGKEFFTVTSAAGNVYYLIIDRQRGTENVYFLSPVTEDDLMGLTDGGAITEPGLTQPEPQTPEPSAPTEQPEQTEPEQEQDGGGTGTIIFILLAVAIAGGAGYYFKIVKPRKETAQVQEDDFEDSPYEDEDTDDGYADEADENEYLSGEDEWEK
jgi:hypothetical protein